MVDGERGGVTSVLLGLHGELGLAGQGRRAGALHHRILGPMDEGLACETDISGTTVFGYQWLIETEKYIFR